MVYIYPATIREQDGTFYAAVPDVPGCVTTGRSLSDAIDQITDALAACLCTLEDVGESIPAASTQDGIPHGPEDICTLIRVDTLAYRAMTDTRAVRKNVSIPAWMANRADQLGINCSKVLQDALRRQLT